MFRRLVWSAVLAGAVGLVVKAALPDLNRYLKIRAMQMEVIGVIALVVLVLFVLLCAVVAVRSIPDYNRYRRLRKM